MGELQSSSEAAAGAWLGPEIDDFRVLPQAAAAADKEAKAGGGAKNKGETKADKEAARKKAKEEKRARPGPRPLGSAQRVLEYLSRYGIR